MKENEISSARESATTSRQTQTSPPRRILVAEDDHSLRRINAKVLSHFGYLVDAAEDGEAAWHALNSGRYDLLVTDNDMPKVSGVELIKKVRAARMALPVIM